MDVGLVDDCRPGFLSDASRFKEAREIAALAQFGNLKVDVACAGLPKTIAVAITAICPVWAFDIEARAAQAFDVEHL
ncbi:hypothetical protein BGP83_14560 [Pseudomonas putida]|nr:hypothetical protein BGP83_14560 [Pseudomonas putida]